MVRVDFFSLRANILFVPHLSSSTDPHLLAAQNMEDLSHHDTKVSREKNDQKEHNPFFYGFAIAFLIKNDFDGETFFLDQVHGALISWFWLKDLFPLLFEKTPPPRTLL